MPILANYQINNVASAQSGATSTLTDRTINSGSGGAIDDYFIFMNRNNVRQIGVDENGDPIYDYGQANFIDYGVQASQLDITNHSVATGINSLAVTANNTTTGIDGLTKSSNSATASENGIARTAGNSISVSSEYPGTINTTIHYFTDESTSSGGGQATVFGNTTRISSDSGTDITSAVFSDTYTSFGNVDNPYDYTVNFTVGGKSGLFAKSTGLQSTSNILSNSYTIMTNDGYDNYSVDVSAEAFQGGNAYVGNNKINLDGGAHDDYLSVALKTVITGESTASVIENDIKIFGGEGNDRLEISFFGAGVARNSAELSGGSGNDTLIVSALGTNRLTLDGGDGNDTLQTAESNFDLRGVNLTSIEHIATANTTGTAFTVDNFASALLIRGTGASDSINGPSFVVATEQYAQLFANGIEIVTDGSSTSYSTVTHTLDAGVTNLLLTGTAAIDGTGNALANSLTGNAAANTLTGGAGDDTLDGKGGSDLMRGGANNDTYWVDDARDLVIEAAGEGTDTVFATASYALGAGQSIELLQLAASTGASNLNLTGNELANTLIGNDGANVLDGGAGADTMQGGLGNDTYWVDNSLDLTIEKAGQGTDTVISTITYTLRAGEAVEILQLAPSTGTSNLNINGNEFANTLIGNDGGNSLNGGLGADIMRGGLGNDYYVVDNILDQVIELADQGNDTIISNIHYTLSPGQSIERLQLDSRTGSANLNLTGNDLANKIVGNDGNNSLDGKGGADTLQGGRGNDYYTVDNAADQTLEAADQGNDTVLSTISYKLMAGQSIERLQFASSAGSSNLNLTGNELANTITGNDGSNVLDGGAGADLLYGRGGADTFVFSTALSAANVDRVNDFSSVDDTIQLARSVFKVLPLGVLDEAAFKVMGTTAIDASDRILYNKSTGALFYDADGSGTASTAIQFAAFDNKATLTAADFLIA